MCGIVGIIKKHKSSLTNVDIEMFREMLICDSIRGEDSTGAFYVDSNYNAHFAKLATSPHLFVKSNEYNELMRQAFQNGQVLVGHNRKATEGVVNNDNAHPFTSGPIVLVHNGHISNFRTLVSMKQRDRLNINVDSHGAAWLLSTHEPLDILKKMSGAYTFVWFNALTKKLYFTRNDQRPLYFAETETAHFFASEGGMLRWMLNRRAVKIVAGNVVSQLPSNILTWLDFTKSTLEFEKLLYGVAPTVEAKEINDALEDARLLANGWKRNDKGIWEFQAGGTKATEVRSQRDTLFTGAKKVVPESELPVTLQRRPTLSLGKPPAEHEWNIHYGHNRFVDDTIPYQRLVWEIEDYKELGASKDIWQVWGKALNSSRIDVVGTFNGTEKQLAAIIESDHLIGTVRRTKESYTPIKQGGSTEKVQQVIVSDIQPCIVMMYPGDVLLLPEHHEHLMDQGHCVCKSSYVDMAESDTDGPHLFYSPISNDIQIQCGWCYEADKSLDKGLKNAQPTNPAL